MAWHPIYSACSNLCQLWHSKTGWKKVLQLLLNIIQVLILPILKKKKEKKKEEVLILPFKSFQLGRRRYCF